MPIDDGIIPPNLPMHPGDETPAEPDFYGGSSETVKWYLPGSSIQFIEFSKMDEGQRKFFQKKVSKGVKVSRKDQSAEIGMDPGGDRESLILAVVKDWYMLDKGNPVAFNGNSVGGVFAQWMNRQNPVLIDKLELAIRDANPWLQDEMDSESIREEIDRLEDLYKVAKTREDEKANFSR